MPESIEDLKKEVEQLRHLAYKDELTGLYNRRGFGDIAGRYIRELASEREYEHRRENFIIRNFSLVLFDIDDFKKLNDAYGHDAGDEALKLFSRILGEHIRDVDIASRWGGEEFLLGLVGASKHDALQIADRVRKSLESQKFIHDDKEISFTVSGGVASFDDAQDTEKMFALADKLLYKAKKEGKNRICA